MVFKDNIFAHNAGKCDLKKLFPHIGCRRATNSMLERLPGKEHYAQELHFSFPEPLQSFQLHQGMSTSSANVK